MSTKPPSSKPPSTKPHLPMSKADFLELVAKNEDGKWLLAPDAARELGLHLSEEELVHAWLVVKDEQVSGSFQKRTGGTVWGPTVVSVPTVKRYRETHVVTDSHYMIVSSRDEVDSEGAPKKTVWAQSAPIGRLRSVSTNESLTTDDGPVGGQLTLHFAGPVFFVGGGGSRDDLTFTEGTGWPSPEVQAFMSAIATVRR